MDCMYVYMVSSSLSDLFLHFASLSVPTFGAEWYVCMFVCLYGCMFFTAEVSVGAACRK